jgi:hypothetical protein
LDAIDPEQELEAEAYEEYLDVVNQINKNNEWEKQFEGIPEDQVKTINIDDLNDQKNLQIYQIHSIKVCQI